MRLPLATYRFRHIASIILGMVVLYSAGCNQIERPKIEPFFSATSPPPAQELRWSNGKTPKSLDPARAGAPPETDLIRAIYEGLTELDSRTLEPKPAVADSWQSSKDHKTWTFQLRAGAKWSNGEPVIAADFVRSWKRLLDLGEKTSNSHLFQHIVGMNTWAKKSDKPGGETVDFLNPVSTETAARVSTPTPTPSPVPTGLGTEPNQKGGDAADSGTRDEGKEPFGAVAVDELTLRVTLRIPDKDFPKLVAHPLFRPVHGTGATSDSTKLDTKPPTNGPFRLTKIEEGSLTLERSDTYWDRNSISLERVRIIATDTPEAALQAYRRGDVDVVTNAKFEPVAVKLLAPYDDFRRMAHNALNFFEINTTRAPFDDRRVRQALSIAIDREKLTDGDLQGVTQPAYGFSPLVRRRTDNLLHDVNKAAELLERAGYPNGYGFPTIRLVINRNDVQQRVAASVARMWKQNLNIDTEISVKEASEMEGIRQTGDFDLIRRGVVLPTNDEAVNLAAVNGKIRDFVDSIPAKNASLEVKERQMGDSNSNTVETDADVGPTPDLPNITDQAIYEMNAIPLYFPISYSLIKPYVRGFEINGLDAPTLKEVSVDNNWQPVAAERESYP